MTYDQWKTTDPADRYGHVRTKESRLTTLSSSREEETKWRMEDGDRAD